MMRHERRGCAGTVALAMATMLLLAVLALLAGTHGWRRLSAPPQPQADPAAQSVPPRAWDESVAPNYYEVVGPSRFGRALVAEGMPSAGDEPRRGEVRYGELDALGRATGVEACVDAELAARGAARERDDVSAIRPSGWGHNEEVAIELPTGRTYHGYFWNRSHLLAKSLGGEEAVQNLVCGTRMQNVGANLREAAGGMAYAEGLARDWLAKNPSGFVLYAATPVYAADELVCRNVVVDLRSSDGTLDLQVVVYNAAKGYQIDYATGTFRAA